MKKRFVSTVKMLAMSIALVAVAVPAAAQEQSRFGVLATEWDSGTVAVPGVVAPIGGAGQVNGEFVTGERYGVQIGIRAQDRFVGTLPVTRSKHTGIYSAAAGYSTAPQATWNYDLHVDLRYAQGVAAGKTLGDYTLVLDSDISPAYFGCAFPCELTTFPGTSGLVLLQGSQNPSFGNPLFDALAEDSYSFTLTLTPKTFNGPPITARMRVDVSAP
jgi:hypothetical protein